MLVDGLGMLARVNDVLTPSRVPPGVSESTKTVLPPLPVPHAPEVPSTCIQSDRFPTAPSIPPDTLITADLETTNPVPWVGRRFRADYNPSTSLIWMLAVCAAGPNVATAPGLRRTSLTRNGVVLGNTAQTSEYCVWPLLLY